MMSQFFIGYTNLIKTILGTGVIIYPYLVSSNGLIKTVCLTALSCFFSLMGLIFYARLNHMKNKTLSTLSSNKIIRKLVNSIIVFKCVSVSISYIVIVGEISDCFCKNFSFNHPIITLLAILFVTIPISTIQRFSKLRFTSFLGVFATLTMVILSFCRFFKYKPVPKIELVRNFNFSDLGSYVFAFTCHQSIFTFQNEKCIPLKTVNYVIISCMISAMIIYIVFGSINSFFFDIKKDFFGSLPPDNITVAMQILFLITVIFAIPLQLNAAQYYLKIENFVTRYIFVISVYLLGVLLYLLKIPLKVYLSGIGGTASCLICFVISGSYFLLYGDSKYKSLQTIAVATLLFGLTILTLTLYTSGKVVIDKLSTFFRY